MIENDEVAILEVEAVQFVAGTFCVHDIFVDDEGGALGVRGNALADLPVVGPESVGVLRDKICGSAVVVA